MSTLVVPATVYGSVALYLVVLGVLALAFARSREERRDAARVLLAGFVWPIAFVWWIANGVAWLIRQAR